ncbi:MAG: pilus assembly protein PilM, partial [Candidatus Omnitrophica bacterium]|nr:pilus assembly protein PilM [Candidatus Omnitrophota bacterium]
RIILTGGGALLSHLRDLFPQNLGIKAEIFDPFQNITFSEKIRDIKTLQKSSLRFTTVMGLALEAGE